MYKIIPNSLKLILSLHAGESFTAPNVTGIVAMSDSITFLWEQDFEIDTYEIQYNFVIKECQGDITEFWNVTINGSLRNFTLENSTDTPVEEDSIYTIYLTAKTSDGRGETSILSDIITERAGVIKIIMHFNNKLFLIFLDNNLFYIL